jgi:hypothetical protein
MFTCYIYFEYLFGHRLLFELNQIGCHPVLTLHDIHAMSLLALPYLQCPELPKYKLDQCKQDQQSLLLRALMPHCSSATYEKHSGLVTSLLVWLGEVRSCSSDGEHSDIQETRAALRQQCFAGECIDVAKHNGRNAMLVELLEEAAAVRHNNQRE